MGMIKENGRLASPSCGGVPPFIFQDGVQVRVSPLAFHPLVLAKMTFAGHADFFEHAVGADILRAAGGGYAVQTELVEAELEQGVGGFGHDPQPPILAVEDVTDPRLADFGVFDVKVRGTDEYVFVFQDDGKGKVLVFVLLFERFSKVEFRFFERVRPPFHMFDDFGIGGIGVDGRPVVFLERAEEEARGVEEDHG